MSASLHADVCRSFQFVRAYARTLARNSTLADDVAQDAMLRAIAHADQFTPGTNFKAWIATIVRNCYFNMIRSAGRAHLVEYTDLHSPVVVGDQEARLAFKECCRVMGRLPTDQQQALMLIAVEGLSYDEAAEVAACATGTMKSRVSRARDRLVELTTR